MDYIYEWRIIMEEIVITIFFLSFDKENFYSPPLFTLYVRVAPIYQTTHAES